jgi:hypothetical protein
MAATGQKNPNGQAMAKYVPGAKLRCHTQHARARGQNEIGASATDTRGGIDGTNKVVSIVYHVGGAKCIDRHTSGQVEHGRQPLPIGRPSRAATRQCAHCARGNIYGANAVVTVVRHVGGARRIDRHTIGVRELGRRPSQIDTVPPARVRTSPEEILMARMRLFNWSATKAVPDVSTATPLGLRNVAHVPCPLADPGVVLPLPPVRVRTAPEKILIARIRWLR